jgi:hypothetical protein
MAAARRTKDMPFQLPPRQSPALASVLAAAGIALTVVGCGHITPLGPDAAPQPSQLRSPIVLEAMRVQFPSPTGKCPAGYAAVAAPGSPTVSAPGSDVVHSPCYRGLGPPATFTAAAVTPYQPRTSSGHGSPGESGLLITLPAADVAALTTVTTRAYDAQGAVDISVAGKTWGLPMQLAPLTHGQFAIVLPSSGQTLQLQRLLGPSG